MFWLKIPGCVATHTNTISNNLVKDIKFLTGKCCFRRLGSIATKTAARGCCEMFLNSSKKVCLVNKSITHSSHTMWHVSCGLSLSGFALAFWVAPILAAALRTCVRLSLWHIVSLVTTQTSLSAQSSAHVHTFICLCNYWKVLVGNQNKWCSWWRINQGQGWWTTHCCQVYINCSISIMN